MPRPNPLSDTTMGAWMLGSDVAPFEDMRLCVPACHPAAVAVLRSECAGLCDPTSDMAAAHAHPYCRAGTAGIARTATSGDTGGTGWLEEWGAVYRRGLDLALPNGTTLHEPLRRLVRVPPAGSSTASTAGSMPGSTAGGTGGQVVAGGLGLEWDGSRWEVHVVQPSAINHPSPKHAPGSDLQAVHHHIRTKQPQASGAQTTGAAAARAPSSISTLATAARPERAPRSSGSGSGGRRALPDVLPPPTTPQDSSTTTSRLQQALPAPRPAVHPAAEAVQSAAVAVQPAGAVRPVGWEWWVMYSVREGELPYLPSHPEHTAFQAMWV